MRWSFAVTASLLALVLLPDAAGAQQITTPRPQSESQQQSPSASPEQQRGVNDAISSESGKAGTQEPSSGIPQNQVNQGVFMNGVLNVPGAPRDSQTVPAKYSQRNAALDKLPIMAWPIGLTDAQRKELLDSIRSSNAPIVKFDAKITEELPASVKLYDLSPVVKSEMPILRDLKYVRLNDKILLVYAPNWIVVDEIKN